LKKKKRIEDSGEQFARLMALYSQLFASSSLIGLKFSLSASAEFTFLGLPKIISFSASCVTGTGLCLVATSKKKNWFIQYKTCLTHPKSWMIGRPNELEDVGRVASSFATYLGKIEATLLAGYWTLRQC